MTWLDMMVLCLVGGSFVKGWRDGFIRQVATLGALLTAIYGCTKVALLLCSLILSAGLASERSVTFVSYISAFILILAIVRWAGHWVEHLVDDGPLSLINHLTGALCAASFALFIVSFTLNLVEGLDRHGFLLSEETKARSRTYPFIRETVPAVFSPKLFVWRKE